MIDLKNELEMSQPLTLTVIRHISPSLEKVPSDRRDEFYSVMKELGGPTVGDFAAQVIGPAAAQHLPPEIRDHIPGTKPADNPLGLDLLPAAFLDALTELSRAGHRVMNTDDTRIREMVGESVETRAQIALTRLGLGS